jgi:transposase
MNKEKEKIISEYLAGGISYRQLQTKYGVDFRTIHAWVQQFRGRYTTSKKPAKLKEAKQSQPIEPLPKEVKLLQVELRRLQLHNELLEAMIDIGKEQFGIDLRKKSGTKQS